MDLGTPTLFIGGAIGLGLAAFGLRMLVTGRAPGPIARAFRTVPDAGLYHLLFGIALMLLVLGTKLPGRTPAIGSAVFAVAIVVVAVVRYRPRGGKKAEEEKP